MKPWKISAILILLTPTITAAEDGADRDVVMRVISNFFAAMTARDVDRMRTLMTPDGIIYSYREGADGLHVVRTTHSAYLENLAKGDARLVERSWNPQVMLHGRLATVWTPYDFHKDAKFSHCGVDNFSLLRTDNGWVITGVVFSIEVEDCADSPLGALPGEQER